LLQKLLKNKKVLYAAGAVAILAGLPIFFGNSTYVMLICSTIGVYAIAVSGLDILFGYSGQISLGHAAFYGIGAYTTSILSKNLGIHPLITIFIGALLAMVIGMLLAFPVSNLVGHFLSLATIAFCELVYIFVTRFPGGITGNFTGFLGVPVVTLFDFRFSTRLSHYYLVAFFLVIFLFVKHRIVHSRIGRAFIAIRDNTHAAGGMGINTRKYKVMAFAISAFYVGFAGSLYAHFKLYVSPEIIARTTSILFLCMLLFGGRASIIGPLIGASVLTIVNESLRAASTYQLLLYGILLMLILLFMPYGIIQYFQDIKNTKIYKKVVAKLVKH